MQKITPFFWFDSQAEDAAKFYVSVFSKSKGAKKKSKILAKAYYEAQAGKRTGKSIGSVMTVSFTLDGQEFVALNGGPRFKFTEAVSFVIDCKTQNEVDYFWNKLSEAGEENMCGWLKDKYGMWWQVVPTVLNKWLLDKNKKRAKRVMNAMLQMQKIDIAKLKEAYDLK
jgi:predicted 3-demethylubiquinone-9 3-methyltransferase (glyoxalase superfamily)